MRDFCITFAELLILAMLSSAGATAAEDPGVELTDPLAIEGRVLSLLALQRLQPALEEARRYHERFPLEPRVRSALGQALFRAGELEEANALLEVDASRPDAPARAVAVLGRLRAAQGRGGEAVELMTRAVAAAPDDREVLYWASGATTTRAESLRRLERYVELSDGDDPDRIEAAQGSIEVLRALGEQVVWVPAERPEHVELPLTRLWNPTTGAVFGFVVRVRIGEKGKPVPLLLDSGSPGFYVIHRVARKRGFVRLAERTAFGGGGERRHRMTRGTFAAVDIGGLRFTNALASTSKQEMDPTGRYHGLLGLAVFNGYRVTLDLQRDRLLLDPPDQSEGDPYWTIEGQMLVRAKLNDADSGLFLFDSGATRTAVDSGLAGRLEGARLGPASVVHGFGGQVQGTRRLEGVEVILQALSTGRGSLNVIDFSTRSRLAGVQVSGFLGLDLLDHGVAVIDTVRRRILLHKKGTDLRSVP